MISNTNSPHKLDSGKYNERVAECQRAVKAVLPYKPINALGELSPEDFDLLSGKLQIRLSESAQSMWLQKFIVPTKQLNA